MPIHPVPDNLASVLAKMQARLTALESITPSAMRLLATNGTANGGTGGAGGPYSGTSHWTFMPSCNSGVFTLQRPQTIMCVTSTSVQIGATVGGGTEMWIATWCVNNSDHTQPAVFVGPVASFSGNLAVSTTAYVAPGAQADVTRVASWLMPAGTYQCGIATMQNIGTLMTVTITGQQTDVYMLGG